jgi:hypothetical protein
LQWSITVINGTITSALSVPPSSFAAGIFFWLGFQPPMNFAEIEFRQGLLMRLVVIERGIIAGLVATATLSAIMLIKQSMGLTPELDLIAVITAMAGASSPVVGWIGHFVIGAVFWAVGFTIVSPYLPGPLRFRGPIFASRIAKEVDRSDDDSEAGAFGRSLGMMAPVATLDLHVLYLVLHSAGLTDCSATNKRRRQSPMRKLNERRTHP